MATRVSVNLLHSRLSSTVAADFRHVGLRARLFSSSSTSASASSEIRSPEVELQQFLNAVGKGVEAHAEKVVKEMGSMSNFLQLRGGLLKKVGIPCQQRKLILRYMEKYRQGVWKP